MFKRMAVVVWWTGALLGGASTIGGLWTGEDYALFYLGVALYLIGASACYVLSGSFWKPPKAEKEAP